MFTCKRLLPVILLTLLIFECNRCVLIADSSVRVRVQYHPEEDFLRLPEFFTGKEFTGDKVIVRSKEQREGIYFYVPLNKSKSSSSKANSIKLDLIDSTSPFPRSFELSVPEEVSKKKTLLIGVTGEDWKEKSLDLVAWKIVLMDKEKKPVFSSQSFLWDHKK